MNPKSTLLVMFTIGTLSACSDSGDTPGEDASGSTPNVSAASDVGEVREIVPGLTMKKTRNGHGRSAKAGDLASVHYTGWLYDEAAADGRGEKFDSSVDRGVQFQFPLGAGRVIKGWDEGVQGMLIGEVRELIVAPEMGYGDRGAGDVIPPGATLLFEVELLALEGPDESS